MGGDMPGTRGIKQQTKKRKERRRKDEKINGIVGSIFYIYWSGSQLRKAPAVAKAFIGNSPPGIAYQI
ncbi:MAG: hypothetical protein GXP46_12115 [Deferribacteres bacterium]|nr:hypothetical protein [Deferribacteres bacterium]